jgi:hypothetical protein
VPSGFDWFQNRTMWDRTNRWELLGPDSPQIDQWHRSGIVTTGPRQSLPEIGPYQQLSYLATTHRDHCSTSARI